MSFGSVLRDGVSLREKVRLNRIFVFKIGMTSILVRIELTHCVSILMEYYVFIYAKNMEVPKNKQILYAGLSAGKLTLHRAFGRLRHIPQGAVILRKQPGLGKYQPKSCDLFLQFVSERG